MALGKWSDGSFYECMIVGETTDEVDSYEVIFTGYESIQVLHSSQLKVPKSGEKRPTLLQSKEVQIGEIKSMKPKYQASSAPGGVKKKRNTSKRDIDDKARVGAWQSFSSKKSVVKKGLLGTLGSSKTATANLKSFTAIEGRTKHNFKQDQELE
jgi:hypothetical protein